MANFGHDNVEARYNAGFIILSYIVSLVGCVTTLELLHRRTSRHGTYNWYLLVTSSITMGGIGIWCMHFIGNRAIVMAEGQPEMQIVYSTGFTSISFFLPIVVLSGAFYLLDATERINRYYVAFAGILMGVAIGAMHYVGQLGISNYHCSYRVGNVVGASIISIVASIGALLVFFRLREAWTDSWWKRVLCGLVLACSVSGMHWTAAVGTWYRFRGLESALSDPLSSTQTVIVCTTLSCATCILLLLVALIAGHKRKTCRSRAQQLVLACGYFDEAGRIMVTTEGTLPTQKIANHYMDKTFCEQEFDRTHPAFIWALRASYNWPTIRALVPGMKNHLDATGSATIYCSEEFTSTGNVSRTLPDFSVIFKELFSLAALNLANQIHQSLETLGTLYEEPLATGRQPPRNGLGSFQRKDENSATSLDLEEASLHSILSAGKFLFVTRQLSRQQVLQFGAAGFRFAPVKHISHSLSKTMKIPNDELAGRLSHMQAQKVSDNMLPAGVHVACFMLRPRLRQGFDVLVPVAKHGQLPAVRLPYDELVPWQREGLERLDGWTVIQVIRWLEENAGVGATSEVDFRRNLLRAMTLLIKDIDDASILQARFSSRMVEAPCRQDDRKGGSQKHCFLVSIYLISTIYTPPPKSDFIFIPLRSFIVQQQLYMGFADQEAFARQAYLEFAHCLEGTDNEDQQSSRRSSRVAMIRTRASGSLPNSPNSRSSFPKSEDEPRSPSSSLEKPAQPPSGAIVVSNHVTVDITDATRASIHEKQRPDEMGTTGRASTVAVETETYVDKLFAFCRGTDSRE